MTTKPGTTKTAQVTDLMRRKISAGEWEVNQPIPGLTDLEQDFGVSFGTVRAAQQILVDEGLLSKPEQGISTRVIARPAPLDARQAIAQARQTYRALGEQLERLAGLAESDTSATVPDLRRLSYQQVHDYARFSAAAAALANGHQEVHIVGRTTRLMIDDRIVQVNSRRQPGSPWQFNLNRPVVEDAVAVIFVDLTGDYPDFYIAPGQWVRDDVKRHHAEWLKSKGGVRPRTPSSDHHSIKLDRVKGWHQRWDAIPQSTTDNAEEAG
jgi:DNA-binding transcriptional regulator YhcF (GntR family)